MSTITPTADAANGRIVLVVTPTVTGSFYVFRRDTAGVGTVRQASEGLALTSGTPVTIYDYEPRQGDVTDYLLTNQDGAVQATGSLTIPAWGTWLKSPGRPWLNVLTRLNDDPDVTRPARREVLQVEGAADVLVLSAIRQTGTGSLVFAVQTAAEMTALLALTADGGVLMVDCSPTWGVSWRYVSAGATKVGRVFRQWGLDRAWRLFTLEDLHAQPAPAGPLQINPTATYDALPVKFATYAAIPATVATYDALAVK